MEFSLPFLAQGITIKFPKINKKSNVIFKLQNVGCLLGGSPFSPQDLHQLRVSNFNVAGHVPVMLMPFESFNDPHHCTLL